MKLIDNLPNQLRDRKDYLIKLKDSIDIPTDCVLSVGNMDTMLQNAERKRKKRQKRNKIK